VVDGFGVDQLTHCLQTATRAEQAGADDELVVASLCHDIGKAVMVPNHPRIAAEILRPYVRPEVTAAIAASWGVLAAGVSQAALLWYGVRRSGAHVDWRWPRLTPQIRQLIGLAVPGAIAASASPFSTSTMPSN